MNPSQEQLVAFITECCVEHKAYLDLSEERINLLASFIRMKMTHEDRLEANEECNKIVAQLKEALDYEIPKRNNT